MSHTPWVPDLDLGDGHSLIWTDWDPDPVLNPQWAHLPPDGPGEHHGAIVRHPIGPNPQEWAKDALPPNLCESAITFDTARNRAGSWADKAIWQVQSWSPFTISPSLLCSCGDHGFIREGRWVRA
jgi:hypothetical protein